MKYALLLWDNPDAWEKVSEADVLSMREEYMAVPSYGGAQLHPAPAGKTLRFADGKPLVTDGPFAETKEVVSGLYLVDADSEEEALRIAATIPTASRMGGVIEVRQIVER
ncbi:MAG: YciI family protein [Actinomycetota bacterium]